MWIQSPTRSSHQHTVNRALRIQYKYIFVKTYMTLGKLFTSLSLTFFLSKNRKINFLLKDTCQRACVYVGVRKPEHSPPSPCVFCWNNQAIVSLPSCCRSVMCLLVSPQDDGCAPQCWWESAILLCFYWKARRVVRAKTPLGGYRCFESVRRFSQLPSAEQSLLNIVLCVMIENFQWE